MLETYPIPPEPAPSTPACFVSFHEAECQAQKHRHSVCGCVYIRVGAVRLRSLAAHP